MADTKRAMSRDFQRRRYEWLLEVCETICAMPEDAVGRLNQWRLQNPEKSDADWPEVQRICGGWPQPAKLLVVTSKERTA